MFPKKNRGGPPKWMVYKGNLIKIDDLGVYPYFWKHPTCFEKEHQVAKHRNGHAEGGSLKKWCVTARAA